MAIKSAVGHGTKKHKIPHNYCFVCGKDNPEGMKLKFVFDDERHRVSCKFRLTSRYTGPPRHAHGGIIATILDEAMGKVNRLRQVVAVTSEMTVKYLKMVPLEKWCTVEGWEDRVEGTAHYHVAEIKNADGEALARSTGKFIAINPEQKFGKFLKKANPSKSLPRSRSTQ